MAINLSSIVGSPGQAVQYAKAWVNFNGTLSTPITPRASYNVSSITKNGTGDYTVNFATAMADANYAIAFGYATSYGATSQVTSTSSSSAPTLQSATQVRVTHNATSGAGLIDCANFYAVVFGN
jgi:hypothetical protein